MKGTPGQPALYFSQLSVFSAVADTCTEGLTKWMRQTAFPNVNPGLWISPFKQAERKMQTPSKRLALEYEWLKALVLHLLLARFPDGQPFISEDWYIGAVWGCCIIGFWEGPILDDIIALGGLDTRPKAGSGGPIPLKKQEKITMLKCYSLEHQLSRVILCLFVCLRQEKVTSIRHWVLQAVACQLLLLLPKMPTRVTGLLLKSTLPRSLKG